MCKVCADREIKGASDSLIEYGSDPAMYHPDRKCRKCKGKLDASRWFHCVKCRPVLRQDPMEEFSGIIREENLKLDG
ncbi:MAG: hypothetical protein EBZ48_06590 [Proteobacteria bacterium]|nr:hypothetical protein [Pseudomonadota bacterium]